MKIKVVVTKSNFSGEEETYNQIVLEEKDLSGDPLDSSLDKWECMEIACDEEIRILGYSGNTCGLCMKYCKSADDTDDSMSCTECPIFIETGKEQCGSTSYYRFVKANSCFEWEERKVAATEMVELLRKLKGKGEMKNEGS
jgi:hypothetical protein